MSGWYTARTMPSSNVRCCLLACCLPLAAQAPVPEVRSTARDRTSLGVTLYHDGLGMVRETRTVALPAGACRLALEDVTREIRFASASVGFLGMGPLLLERNVEFSLLNPGALADAALGEPVAHRDEDGSLSPWGTLASLSRIPLRQRALSPVERVARRYGYARPVLIQTPTGLYSSNGNAFVFKALPGDLRRQTTLLADVATPAASVFPLELAYTTKGLTWEVTYTGRLAPGGRTMDLEAWVTLTNTSGMDLPNATLQLVAGHPNVIHEPPMLPHEEPQLDGTRVVEVVAAAVVPSFKEAKLSEYPLYTLDRPTTIREGQTKQVRLFSAERIPLKRSVWFTWSPCLDWYRHPATRSQAPGPWIEGFEHPALRMAGLRDGEISTEAAIERGNTALGAWDSSPMGHIPLQTPVWESPALALAFPNTEQAHLGRPLPKGSLHLSQRTPEGAELPLGEATLDQAPVGEEVVALFPDHRARGIRGSHRWRPLRWMTQPTEDQDRDASDRLLLEGEATFTNAWPEPVEARVLLTLSSGATVQSVRGATHAVSGDRIEFRLTLPARRTHRLTYRVEMPASFPVP